MRVIGLTGGIASGKSTISDYLRQHGAIVIDADVLAREIVRRGQPAWQDIVSCFGKEVLQEDGEIDRVRLGQKVFSDQRARELLNRITHPRVIEKTRETIGRIKKVRPDAVVVVDAPLLIEAGMDSLVDEVWVVAVDEETQVQRVMERDGLDRTAARQRIASQMPLKEKIKRADRVIDNQGPLAKTLADVEKYWKEACKAARRSHKEQKREADCRGG